MLMLFKKVTFSALCAFSPSFVFAYIVMCKNFHFSAAHKHAYTIYHLVLPIVCISWCRILMGMMCPLANLRGRFSWLLMLLQNGKYKCFAPYCNAYFASFNISTNRNYFDWLTWSNFSGLQWSDIIQLLGAVGFICEVQESRYDAASFICFNI